MDTIPEPFSLRNPSGHTSLGRGGFRVPFGLKDGRVWAPGEVTKGKACGCVCPGCAAPLTAKAQESRRKRPHFAHLIDSGCVTGRETGIHLRAKQLIAERLVLAIPAWDGDLFDRPNPPYARDAEGRIHHGRAIERPATHVRLRDVVVEKSLGAYQPDVRAWDDAGELLIEIRVTHAVDDNKARRVQADRQRMIEIDLSGIDRNTPHDPIAFEHAVLFEPVNRTWISCPDAVADWAASKLALDNFVAARNREIAEQRDRRPKIAHSRHQRRLEHDIDKERRKAHVREVKRAMHAEDLAKLGELTRAERVEQVRRVYQREAAARVDALAASVSSAVRTACTRAHQDAWIYGVDPVLWQLLTYDHFVARQRPGYHFNQKDVASWVLRSFQHDQVLYRLFKAQYVHRAEAIRAGIRKRRMDYWVFTDEENQRIPNFYAPINDFIDRLEGAGAIRRLWHPLGECEVAAPSDPNGNSFNSARADFQIE